MANNQAVTYKTLSGGHQLTHPSGEGVFVVLLVLFLIFFTDGFAHLVDSGVNQERAKQVENPAELGDQHRTQGNKDKAQHQGNDDAVHQGFLLVFTRHPEGTQNNDKNEQVIYAQRPLGEPAGIELARILAPIDGPHQHPKQHCQADIANRPGGGFFHGGGVRLAHMAHNVHRNQRNDDGD